MNNYEKYELQKHSSMKIQNYLLDKMNFDSDIIISKLNNINLISTKSISNNIPKDINLIEICTRVVNSSILSNGENNIYIKLSEEELLKRQYVIECIKNFINSFKIKYKIFYNIIFLFDILIYIDNKVKVIQNYEQLGLGSTILIIKYYHEDLKNISINKYQSFYERIHYPKIILKKIEILCLKLIDYYMNFPSPILFIELYSFNEFIYNLDNINNDMHFKLYNMTINTLEKIMTLSNEYTKYNLLNFTSSLIAYSRENYNLEKWPKNLSKVFNINLKCFENIVDELLSFENNMNIKYLSIKNKLFYKKVDEKIFIIKKYKDEKEFEKNRKVTYNNHINKDIKVNKNNNNLEINTIKINNNDLNINLNYRTSEEMKKSALFRKINNKNNNKTLLRELNSSNSLNNINNQINVLNTMSNNIKNENGTNSYKTPDKIINNKNSILFSNQNRYSFKYYNNANHQRNKSNIDIITNKNYENILDYDKENQILDNQDNIDNYEQNENNSETINNKLITINKKEERNMYKKLYNKINKDINTNTKEKEKEEIKVRVKEFNYQGDKQKINHYISKYSGLILENKNDNNNNNSKIMNNITYKKNILQKNNRSIIIIKNINNNKPDNNLRKNSEDSFMKNISINRLSSCNNKFKVKNIYTHHKEDDYSNETTSENSHNISIRRNYFRLKRFKDSSINIKNENVTTVSNSNDTSNYIIKCNLKNRDNANYNKSIKYSKIKDCLKIGSIDRKFHNRISDAHHDFNSTNNIKKNEIRSYYKLKKNQFF